MQDISIVRTVAELMLDALVPVGRILVAVLAIWGD